MNMFNFANTVEPDEASLNEPPHQDLNCLSSISLNSQYDIAWTKHFLKFCRYFSFVF